MFRYLFFAIAFSIAMIGCGERWGGPIYPVPHIPESAPAPSESDVISDIQEQFGAHIEPIVESEIIGVDSRVYIVIVENGTETPTFYKVTYYLLDGEWVCIPEAIKM